jgi:hypothetical protein
MISPKDAAELVKKETKYQFIVNVKDFDSEHYVVQALPKKDKISIGVQTTFGVDKESGEVTGFALNYGNNLDKFLAAKVCEI